MILLCKGFGRLAQLVEQLTLNQPVVGSNPPSPIQKCGFSEVDKKILLKSCFSDPDLMKVIEAWPMLSVEIRQIIVRILK